MNLWVVNLWTTYQFGLHCTGGESVDGELIMICVIDFLNRNYLVF